MHRFIEKTHPEWHSLIENAFFCMDKSYLDALQRATDWLPLQPNLLSAFSQPLSSMRYILLGESPYPRVRSANGFAFWDASVGSIWSPTGLSKEVNRATSLRNFIKMLLLARGDLSSSFSQETIAQLDKTPYWQTLSELFLGMIRQGFLLLNASLVYSEGRVPYHAKHWQPFMSCLFLQLSRLAPKVKLILFGQIAKKIPEASLFSCLVAEHPYNVSFITNEAVLAFFNPLDLLSSHEA